MTLAFRRLAPSRLLALCAVATCPLIVCQSPGQAQENWYTRSFYLLHEDHHTSDAHEVGRDADPVRTGELINLSKPDVIQIHAKGNPGWTTYPTQIGHTPPKLRRDVMRVWRDIANRYHYPFSVYYNIGRDGEIMKRHPEWNRSDAKGNEIERALCYHSGVAEKYLWPMVGEIMQHYHPDGWWFDGSCFTVRLCYCPKCRDRRLRSVATIRIGLSIITCNGRSIVNSSIRPRPRSTKSTRIAWWRSTGPILCGCRRSLTLVWPI
jgi:hypothetical protein